MPPSAQNNPAGYWESLGLVAVHDDMLQAIGSSWHDISPLPPFWENPEFILPYQARIVEALKSSYGESTFFVVKDPRIARFVPVTIAALHELGVTPKFVIAIRNPLEVAASLKARNGFHFAKSLLLWLDLTFPAWSSANDIQVESFIKTALRHHVYAAKDVNIRKDVSQWVKVSFEAMHSLARGATANALARLDRVHAEFGTAQVAFSPLLAQEELSRQRLVKDLEGVRFEAGDRKAKLDTRDNEVKSLASKLQVQETRATELKAKLDTRDTELEAGKARIEELERTVASRETELRARVRELNGRMADVKAVAGRITSLEAQLSAVYASRSWRITGPLRAVTRHIRRLL
jgi:hypothetical protein